jgi:hypothetical protein
MGSWLFGGYAVLLFVLGSCAGRVALSVSDPTRRADGYRVLKLVLTTLTTAGGAILELHQLGVL